MAGPPDVGYFIQNYRKKAGLSFDELAAKCGVSKGMLSQIESGKTNPTIATVWKISSGLGIQFSELFQSGTEERKFDTFRKEDITVLETDEGDAHIRVLSPLSMAEDLEFYWLEFKPRGLLLSKPHALNTEEHLTCIKGSILVEAGGQSTELKPGDFIIYHADIQHKIENLSEEKAEVHLVVRFL
jgi:transcriptional regulator with XRE-family HTH domain